MAELGKLFIKVNFKNAREIKKATKAVRKLAKSFERLNLSIEIASESMRKFNDSLPVLEEEIE